jgi:hypothetical protein
MHPAKLKIATEFKGDLKRFKIDNVRFDNKKASQISLRGLG